MLNSKNDQKNIYKVVNRKTFEQHARKERDWYNSQCIIPFVQFDTCLHLNLSCYTHEAEYRKRGVVIDEQIESLHIDLVDNSDIESDNDDNAKLTFNCNIFKCTWWHGKYSVVTIPVSINMYYIQT